MRGIILVACLCAYVAAQYDNYKVIEVTAQTKEQADYLHLTQLSDDKLDFWGEVPRVGHGSIKVMMSPKKFVTFTTKLRGRGIPWTLVEDNVQEQVQEEKIRLAARIQQRNFDINDYNTFEDITTEIEQWVQSCSGGLSCTKRSIGTTHEGEDIEMIHLSTGSGRRAIWLDATIHAREWLATATILKVLDNFISNYGSDVEVTELLDEFDWYIVPVVNPDGYKFTWTNNRYWRKNRSPVGSGCRGVDLNRNYNWRWGNEGVSHSPCSDLYCGPDPASELETVAVQDEIISITEGQTMIALVSFHSYGRMWMHPWGNTIDYRGAVCERADDHDDMFAVAEATGQAIQATHNTNWEWGTSCEVIYATTGGTDDWSKGVADVKYSFNPELRGSDFVIHPSNIHLSFEEVWNGLVAMGDALPDL